jgi:hypothetical protein
MRRSRIADVSQTNQLFQVEPRRYPTWIRVLAFLLGGTLLWSGSNYLRDLVGGFARAHGLGRLYLVVVLSSAVFGALLIYVGARGGVPRWLARVNEGPRFKSPDSAG